MPEVIGNALVFCISAIRSTKQQPRAGLFMVCFVTAVCYMGDSQV